MPARFLTDLYTVDRSPKIGCICFELTQPLVYESPLLGRTVIIPAGFCTDFLSIPWLIQNLLHPVGEYDEGAVLHDFLYRTGGVSRKQADDALLEAMGCAYRPRWQRYAIWAGLRVGGWVVWNDYRRKERQHG
jgi:hypothetical protein